MSRDDSIPSISKEDGPPTLLPRVLSDGSPSSLESQTRINSHDRANNQTNNVRFNLEEPNSNGTDTDFDTTTCQMENFADIIAAAFVRANKTDFGSQSQSRSREQSLGVTGRTLDSGLEIVHNPRSTKQ